ncbi:globin [Pseudalkalibacillus caeni]|uniref:Globin n=1 Tax=Exobacillus caeni TaxID=2574798 RepID=A0A5R9FHB4_9BACL|nr:globin [Pseudalkalibacillus caeni]TLS38955.1 globin [Pseudalkalibacillus caeni]
MDITSQTTYDLIGGERSLQQLVEAFYPKVYSDPLLSPLFNGDMNEIMRKQKMFLTQLLGGPPLYSREFGPPAMRARHMPFEITPVRAQAWLRCMREALDEVEMDGTIRELFFARLSQIAGIMVNASDKNERED